MKDIKYLKFLIIYYKKIKKCIDKIKKIIYNLYLSGGDTLMNAGVVQW